MGEPIKTFSDGSSMEFGTGRIDGWCVYVTTPGGVRAAPRDADYFHSLERLAQAHGADRVYDDFVRLYDITGRAVTAEALTAIDRIAAGYGRDCLTADKTFTAFYLAMVAEENRANTRLGRRIKRLGVHELLKNKKSIQYATTFMTGKGWREIDRLCRERGF